MRIVIIERDSHYNIWQTLQNGQSFLSIYLSTELLFVYVCTHVCQRDVCVCMCVLVSLCVRVRVRACLKLLF